MVLESTRRIIEWEVMRYNGWFKKGLEDQGTTGEEEVPRSRPQRLRTHGVRLGVCCGSGQT